MTDQKKIKINLPPDRAEAKYSDFAVIAKNLLGFIIDFGQRMPGGDTINIVSRIAISPQHAKLISNLMAKNIRAYEEQYGEIKLPQVKGDASDDKVIHFVK